LAITALLAPGAGVPAAPTVRGVRLGVDALTFTADVSVAARLVVAVQERVARSAETILTFVAGWVTVLGTMGVHRLILFAVGVGRTADGGG